MGKAQGVGLPRQRHGRLAVLRQQRRRLRQVARHGAIDKGGAIGRCLQRRQAGQHGLPRRVGQHRPQSGETGKHAREARRGADA